MEFEIERHAVRAILLTPNREVLLMRIRSASSLRDFWVAPGGGLEPGEEFDYGLRREIREELSLTSFTIGPLVWLRQVTFNGSIKRIRQHERFYIVNIDRFDPVINDKEEERSLDRFHWWNIAELEETTEEIAPLSLARIIREYLAGGPPKESDLMVEVIID